MLGRRGKNDGKPFALREDTQRQPHGLRLSLTGVALHNRGNVGFALHAQFEEFRLHANSIAFLYRV